MFILVLLVVVLPSRKAKPASDPQRLAGQDRYSTAIEISKAGWQQTQNVVLATGEDFPDALCAAPLAKQLDAPILLTQKLDLSGGLQEEFIRLKVKNVYIIGGTGVVSKNIEDALTRKNISVTRISGSDRYQTSIEVADYISSKFPIGKEIAIATGENFPDALAGSALAPKSSSPILLVYKNLFTSTKDFFQLKYPSVNNIKILGGEGVVPPSILQNIMLKDTNAAVGNTSGNILNGGMITRQGEWVYYNYNGISKMKVDGTGKVNLSYAKATEINVVGDWIYYLDTSNNLRNIYKLKTDGSEKIDLKISAYDVNVFGDWIYYFKIGDIYKAKIDGTNETIVFDSSMMASDLYIVGDWVYFREALDIYKVKMDGSEKTKVM